MHWPQWPNLVRHCQLATATIGKQYQTDFVCRCHTFCFVYCSCMFCFPRDALHQSNISKIFTNFNERKRGREFPSKMRVIQNARTTSQPPLDEHELPGIIHFVCNRENDFVTKTLYKDVLSTCRALDLYWQNTLILDKYKRKHTHTQTTNHEKRVN